MLRKYIDEKMLLTLVLAAVIIFFLRHYLTKKIIKDGKVSAYVGSDATGWQEI